MGFSWILAAHYSGVRFAYLAEVVTDPGASEPACDRVDFDAASAGEPSLDACGGDASSLTSSQSGPWILHYCEVYNITYEDGDGLRRTTYFDKRAVNRTLRTEVKAGILPAVNSLLDCKAPLFELLPPDVLGRSGPASESLFRRSAWLMCTTLGALNSGLRRYKQRYCPEGVQADDKAQETLVAAPLAAQVSDMFSRAGQHRRNATTIDWAEKLKATQERLAKRRASVEEK